MKPIYIKRNGGKKASWIWILPVLIVVGLMIILFRVIAPYAIESWINSSRPNEAYKFDYRVSDIDLKIMKKEILLQDLKISDRDTGTNFAEANLIRLKFNPVFFFSDDKFISFSSDRLDVILSSDILSELYRLSKLSKHVNAEIRKLDIKQLTENNLKTILSLRNLSFEITNSELQFSSDVSDGGNLYMKGNIETLNGTLKDVTPSFLDKLAGDKLPLTFSDPTIDARITITNRTGLIEGLISSDVSDVKLTGEDPLKRRRSVLKTTVTPSGPLLEIPFTITEGFILDFQSTIEQLRKSNL